MPDFRVSGYEILEVINEGAFGVVYKAKDKTTNETVAIKADHDGLSNSALIEVDVLESLPRHTNIVGFKKRVVEGDSLLVVMEYLEWDLKTMREKLRTPFPPDLIKALIFEILAGVAFLHDHGFVHRDLKPANVLFGSKNRTKICDFGVSARLGCLWGGGVGTMLYKAPEILADWHSYTSGVDVWSVGCMMAEFVLDKPLFNGRSDAHQLECIRSLVCGPISLVPLYMAMSVSLSGATKLSRSGLDLLEKLLAFYPWHRISARDALNHPWFKEDL
ncbi:Mitogen-activated protein kinase 15 [Salvia divinorum]|uniref:Mitogen-activated protein kinase 15 n=1 Tax=Salvia divinorum TaxID=28513 RepID=A0ABD1IHH3_SALDI